MFEGVVGFLRTFWAVSWHFIRRRGSCVKLARDTSYTHHTLHSKRTNCTNDCIKITPPDPFCLLTQTGCAFSRSGSAFASLSAWTGVRGT